jgi:ribosomal protein S18 acetylase RimI-like enzyme
MNDTLLSRIEDASLNASAPPQQLWLDGWLVRLCPGKAKRARSVNAVALGREPVAKKLEAAAQLYREAQLPLVVRLTPFSLPPTLDAELAAAGYLQFDRTHVMVAALQPNMPQPALPTGVSLQQVDADSYAEAVGELRGSPAAHRRSHAARLKQSPVTYEGWFLRDRPAGSAVLACGQFAREAEFVGLYDVFTAPEARGRGLAKALCASLLSTAVAQGARTAYLQVDASNVAAIAVYRSLGFALGYDYHYRALDPAAAV